MRGVAVNVTVHVLPLRFWMYQVWLSRYPVTSVPMSMQPSPLMSSIRVIGPVAPSRPVPDSWRYVPLA